MNNPNENQNQGNSNNPYNHEDSRRNYDQEGQQNPNQQYQDNRPNEDYRRNQYADQGRDQGRDPRDNRGYRDQEAPNAQGGYGSYQEQGYQDRREGYNPNQQAPQGQDRRDGYNPNQQYPQGQQGYNPNQGYSQGYSQGQDQGYNPNEQGTGPQGQNPNVNRENTPQVNRGPNEFKLAWDETLSWVKTTLSKQPTDVVVKARKSNNKFVWVVVIAIFAVLQALVGLFNSLQFANIGGAGYIVGSFFMGILQAVTYMIAPAVVILLSQVIAKKFDAKRWYEPLNGAAAILFPRILAAPLLMIFGSFLNPFTIFLVNLISAVVGTLEILLVLRAIRVDNEKNKNEWITIGLLILFSVLALANGYVSLGVPVPNINNIWDLF